MSSVQAKEVVSSIATFFSTNPSVPETTDVEDSLENPRLLHIDALKVISVVQEAEGILRSEPTLLTLRSPTVVIGDIHGQCFDLLKVFKYTLGSQMLGLSPIVSKRTTTHNEIVYNSSETRPLPELNNGVYRFDPQRVSGLGSLALSSSVGNEDSNHSYLFLGDYVDRGKFSTECALLLMALKVAYPTRIYLLRGNHESRCMTQWDFSEGSNFHDECVKKYSKECYDIFMKCFDCLPLAAVLENDLGRWLCCHGGIGPKVTGLNMINSINRFVEPPLSGPMCDLLWADPLLEEVLGKRMSNKDYAEFMELDYFPNPPRGCSCFYGYAALAPMLKESNVLGIIRAHQCKEEGIHYCYTDNRETVFPFPLVTTVFSAANYCGTYTNKGAVMVFTDQDIQVVKYDSTGNIWTENAPYCSPPKPEVTEMQVEVESSPELSDSNVVDRNIEKPFRQRSGATSKKQDALSLPSLPEDQPTRSLSVSYAQPVPIRRRGDIRRKSMSLIRKGVTGEGGSEAFKQALEKDAEHEIHPGWKSVRRIASAISTVHTLINQKSIEEKTSPSPTLTRLDEESDSSSTSSDDVKLLHDSPSPLQKSISRGLLNKVDAKCSNQIKLLFDSIDINGDGHLTVQELTIFAKDLGITHDADIKTEVEKIVQEMDEDKNGTISLSEFTQYLTKISLLEFL